MVEGVESFDPDVKRFRFGKTHCLGHLHVKVLDPRAVEESAGRISELTERFRGEKRGVKSGLEISWIGVDFERPGRDSGRIEQLIIDSIAQRAEERAVGIVK